MRKIVLPLIETDRSLLALQYAKKHFTKEQAEIIIVMSDESLGISATREEEAAAISVVERKLDVIKKVLDGYQVITKAFVGKAGPCIVKVAREYNADYIVMTKSAREDTLSMVGKTTDYVLNNACCNVLIISENRLNSGEYKGLIYKKAQATVNLRGQIGDKQSECLLPSVDADCNYHFDVTVGKIRFFHTAYNPETGNWDMPPAGDQTASMDIVAGSTADILVKANSIDGKADRIRIINRGMKQEAVFGYKITAAVAPKPLEIPEAPGAMPAPAVISLDYDETSNAVNEETEIDTESAWEDIPVPSLNDTGEFEGIAIEDDFDVFEEFDLDEELGIAEPIEETVEESGVAEPIEESAEEFGVAEPIEESAEEAVDDTVAEAVEDYSEINDYIGKNEFSFDWSDISYDDDIQDVDDALRNTLTGLEMFTPNEDEISSIVDELKDTITSLDNDIAAREGQAVRFGMPADEDLESDFNIENFFENTGIKDNDKMSVTNPAFDDIFELLTPRDAEKHATTSTINRDFDEIINEFRTSQMGSVEVSADDDINWDEYK